VTRPLSRPPGLGSPRSPADSLAGPDGKPARPGRDSPWDRQGASLVARGSRRRILAGPTSRFSMTQQPSGRPADQQAWFGRLGAAIAAGGGGLLLLWEGADWADQPTGHQEDRSQDSDPGFPPLPHQVPRPRKKICRFPRACENATAAAVIAISRILAAADRRRRAASPRPAESQRRARRGS
jgi:hypothetical protein